MEVPAIGNDCCYVHAPCRATLRLDQDRFEQGSFTVSATANSTTQLYEPVLVLPLIVTVAHHPQLEVSADTSGCMVDVGECTVRHTFCIEPPAHCANF